MRSRCKQCDGLEPLGCRCSSGPSLRDKTPEERRELVEEALFRVWKTQRSVALTLGRQPPILTPDYAYRAVDQAERLEKSVQARMYAWRFLATASRAAGRAEEAEMYEEHAEELRLILEEARRH